MVPSYILYELIITFFFFTELIITFIHGRKRIITSQNMAFCSAIDVNMFKKKTYFHCDEEDQLHFPFLFGTSPSGLMHM